MVVHRLKRRRLEPGGRGDLERMMSVAMIGAKPPSEQFVVDAQPAALLLGVGMLDRQEAFDEHGLGQSQVPVPDASDIALSVDAERSGARRLAWRRQSCGPRAS